jgi:magnesium-transporting ATPase (P-type)
MGRRGTEVAKQAADIVLADDNFATIVAAIEEGRSIKANIRRFASYVFTSNVAELAPFLIFIFLPVPLPLMIVQVLAVDLGTDLLPAMALGAEPPSPRGRLLVRCSRAPGVQAVPLLRRHQALLGWPASLRSPGTDGGHSIARSYASNDELAHSRYRLRAVGCLFAQRDGASRRLSLTSNTWIFWGLMFELALALMVVYIPGINGLFAMEGPPVAWLAILPLGAAAFLLIDQCRRLLVERPDRRS